MTCPICRQRKPKRFCPAQGEKICAICCGTGREATIDCPSDCPYLIAAHRYEREHRAPLAADQVPYSDVRIAADLVEEHEGFVLWLCKTLVEGAQATHATDENGLAALGAMAEAYRTLRSGIYYEKPPDGLIALELYKRIAAGIANYKKEQAQRAGFPSVKDGEVFDVLVFLLRVGKQETNGRPLSRAFLDFLRGWVPATDQPGEAKRIILA